MLVTLTVDGRRREIEAEPSRTPAAALEPSHTPAAALEPSHTPAAALEPARGRPGCADGTCGACTVLVNGQATRSCLMLAVQCGNAEVVTPDGLPAGHPLRPALAAGGAGGCGSCLPGLVMLAAEALHDRRPVDDRLLASNVCWCGDHDRVRRAVSQAAARSGP